MPETYSLAKVAQHARSPFVAAPVVIPDSAARDGHIQATMRTGQQQLCKGPDGQQRYYTIDAERSRPGGPIYLLAVRP